MFHSQFLAKNVAIYEFFARVIETFGNLTGVKDMTNSMSGPRRENVMLYFACSEVSPVLRYIDILNNF